MIKIIQDPLLIWFSYIFMSSISIYSLSSTGDVGQGTVVELLLIDVATPWSWSRGAMRWDPRHDPHQVPEKQKKTALEAA